MKKIFLLASVLFALDVSASDLASGASGGMGGGPFADQAPAGYKLSGVTVCSGTKVDSVQAIYTGYGQTIKGQKHGGNGGVCETITVQGSEFINYVSGCKTASTVQQLVIYTSTRRIMSKGIACNSGGAKFSYGAFFASTPSKWLIQGFSGRSGVYLDAIGIVVGDNPDTTVTDDPYFALGNAGGSGGDWYYLFAGNNNKINKITVCSGTKIDSISINDGPKKGGNGGGCNSLSLSANEYISELSGYYDSRGGVISLKVFTTYGRALYAGTPQATDNYSFKGDGENKKITGIIGQSGDRIDAIGISYGRPLF